MVLNALLISSTLIRASVSGSVHSRMNCQSEGRFRHPYDCGSFVDCLPDPETNKLYSREGSCNGQAFHPTFKKCVDVEKVCPPSLLCSVLSLPQITGQRFLLGKFVQRDTQGLQ